MAAAIIGRKVGMTQVFTDDGLCVPVTVVVAGPCFVSQVKTVENDGYSAIQLAFEEIKPRRSTMALIGHDSKAGLAPMKVHKELRLDEKDAAAFQVGQQVSVENFETIKFVDVIGVSKGKGFQGVMKRHGFKGMPDSHGTERKHRSAGSISAHATNRGWSGGPRAGHKMAGQMGNVQVTTRSLDVVSIDKENNLMMIKGSVPGGKNGILYIRASTRLYKTKSVAQKAAAK